MLSVLNKRSISSGVNMRGSESDSKVENAYAEGSESSKVDAGGIPEKPYIPAGGGESKVDAGGMPENPYLADDDDSSHGSPELEEDETPGQSLPNCDGVGGRRSKVELAGILDGPAEVRK